MAATEYEIQFKNSSNNAYHFGVYQDYPKSPGLKSVVWQVRGLPPNSRNKVTWQMNFGVAIAGWDVNDESFSGLQIVPAELGKAYRVAIQQVNIPGIQTDPIALPVVEASLEPNQIKLHNDTSQKFDLGFAVDGNLIAVTPSCGNQWANFNVHPSYYVALYRDIKLGKLIDSGIQVGPVKVEFNSGCRKVLVECTTELGRDVLKQEVII